MSFNVCSRVEDEISQGKGSACENQIMIDGACDYPSSGRIATEKILQGKTHI